MNKATWKPKRLGDLISIKHGWPFKSEQFSEQLTGLPIVVAVGNFQYSGGFRFDSTATKEYRGEYPHEYLLEPGDVLLVMTCQTAGGEILGIPARIPDDGRQYLHNQRLGKVVLKVEDTVDLGFLYWVFLSKPFNRELCASASGTKIVHTAPTRIEAYQFDLPPLPEQQAIASILGALDDKIELNRRRNRTLEATARALFQSWFIDFDPVKAKAAGRKPAGLSKELAALFPASFEDSELGDIPKGWRVGTLGEVAENPRRGIAADAIPVGTPYIALEHMPRRSITLADWSSDAAIESNKFEFCKGEILFGKLRPYFHKVGIAPVNGVCSTDILVVVPKHSDWFGFAACHASSDAIIQHADRASTGTKMPRSNWNDLVRFEVVLPPVEIARVFSGSFRVMVDRIHHDIAESRTLAALRDALLPKLISGELRVPDAERIVGRAV